jgi:dTDP-glucose 4,6-dehydratase
MSRLMLRESFLVTGGAGFIGANFVSTGWRQRRAGRQPRRADLRRQPARTSPRWQGDARHIFVHGDICDRALIDRLLAEHRPRAIVHFAAESHVDRSHPRPGRLHAHQRKRHLHPARSRARPLERARRRRQAAFRFLHVSTDEVYGSLGPNDPAFTETKTYEPNSPYSASKAASDHLVRAWHHTYGLPVLTTNCSNNYGPYHFPEKLIPLMIVNALAGKPLPVYGDGQQIRDWLYVGDHCSAIREVLAAAAWARPTTSAAGTRSPTSRSCTPSARCSTSCKPARGRQLRRLITYVKDRPGHDRRYAIDARKIERELGWRPAETFETGIRKTVSGTWTTRTGSPTCRAAPTATGWQATTPARVQRMKILLLGKNGQVGWELQRALAPLGELVALDSDGADGPAATLEPTRRASPPPCARSPPT